MAKNLWGDLSSLAVVRTPKTILEEQAALLTEATDGMLVGLIEDLTNAQQFVYGLNVVVPSLNNYKYRILTVVHPLEMYPAQVIANRPSVNAPYANEADYEGVVAKILSSSEVKAALSHLKSQIVRP